MRLREQLEAAGYQLSFVHARYFRMPDGKVQRVWSDDVTADMELSPTGGFTCVFVSAPGIFMQGEARCRVGDEFNRRYGEELALRRAMVNAWEQADKTHSTLRSLGTPPTKAARALWLSEEAVHGD